MTEEIQPVAHGRSHRAAHFFNRLYRYRKLLRSRWWVLALGIALAIGIQAIVMSQMPPVFTSSGRMIVSVKLSLPDSALYSEELNNFYGTQTALMQSASVVNRVQLRLQSSNPDLHAVPVNLQVTISPKTSIFILKALGANPEYTQAYLSATMAEYVNLKKELREQASDTTRNSIKEELVRMDSELKARKEELVNYQSSNSVVLLQDQGSSANTYLGSLNKQLADVTSDLAMLRLLTLDQNLEREQNLAQQRLNQQARTENATGSDPKSKDGKPPADTAPTNDDSKDPNKTPSTLGSSESEYLQAKQQILLVKAQQTELSEFLRPKHPKMIALAEDIARKEKLLEIFRDQSKDQLANKEHVMELQIKNVEAEIARWEAKCLEISKKMSDYQVIKENNTRLQNMYDSLLTTMRTLDVGKEISQESVTILEPATPASLVPPEKAKHFGMAGVIGLVLGIGILMLIDRVDDRPASISELEDVFDETILGQVPYIKAKGKGSDVPVIQEDDERHGLVESFLNLRSALVLMGTPENHAKTLLLTSAIPGDGKSMTTANLAITMASAGPRGLLVDADLRRGQLHKRLNVESLPGLGDVLTGAVDWRKAVLPTSIPNLSLLPRGACPRNPGKLFLLPSKDQFFKEAKAEYDYVLFDSAPVMAADDVSNLAPLVDGVIMVIRASYTSARVARAALDVLYLRNVNVLGVVFNAVEADGSEDDYYRYREYYSDSPPNQA